MIPLFQGMPFRHALIFLPFWNFLRRGMFSPVYTYPKTTGLKNRRFEMSRDIFNQEA